MTIRDQILADVTAAMKARDPLRLGVVRMLKSRLQEAEVELRASKGPAYALSDDEALAVIGAYAKQRRDSIEAFRKGGRDDLAIGEEAELVVVQTYLPAQMSDDEVRRIVVESIATCGATSSKDLGAVMKIVVPRVKGAADGRKVNQIVRELLSAG